MRVRVTTVLGIVMLAVAAGCGVWLVNRVGGYEADAAVVDAAREASDAGLADPSATDGWVPDVDEALLRRVDFDAFSHDAPDATRWLSVPGTAIDGPVMQERQVGVWAYDLADMYGRHNGIGSYLTPALREGSTDGHLVVLAHRMNGFFGEWQFSMLEPRWGSEQGAREFPHVYLYYPDHSERWLVWSGIEARSDDVIYELGHALGSDGYEAMLAHVADAGRYQACERPDRWCPTLMLSTCQTLESGELGRFALWCVPDMRYDYATGVTTDLSWEQGVVTWRAGCEADEASRMAPASTQAETGEA